MQGSVREVDTITFQLLLLLFIAIIIVMRERLAAAVFLQWTKMLYITTEFFRICVTISKGLEGRKGEKFVNKN